MRAGIGAAGLASLGLSRPSLAQAAGSRVLKFVPQADLTVIDPVMTTAYITRHHGLMVWDQLYGLDSKLQPQPQMVQGHTVEEDGKRWTFKLRPGLVFHDGEPVRGRDCVASIKRWAQRDALGQILLSRTAEMTAPADDTFVIRLTKPFGPMLDTLAKVGPPALLIMPERIANADAFKPITEIVGSGPFKWKADERIVGARVVYEKFAGYKPREGGTVDWLSGPKIVNFDSVEWTVMPDSSTKAAALMNGEVDWWENPPNDLLPLLQRSRDLTLETHAVLGTPGTGVFNHLHHPFDKVEIRRAVLAAASQEDFQTAAAGTDPSMWKADMGIFTPDTPMASKAGLEAVTGPRDYAAAKKAIAAAGYNGERIVLMAASDQPVLNALGDVCHDLLAHKLGMNVDYVVTDWGTVVQRRASKEPPSKGGWNMFNTTWSGLDLINPAVHATLRSNGDKAFFGWPSIPEIETLREAWLDAPDLAAQQKICADIQKVAFDKVPYLPTGTYFSKSAWRKNITGILTGQIVFWNMKRV
ncbi:ABC transporter substrate-binding protein [Acetobacteraceae bacterium H6797]|nr:ABC transporter substrate-binding protein [Acetobacteraceae bacterium H6797]